MHPHQNYSSSKLILIIIIIKSSSHQVIIIIIKVDHHQSSLLSIWYALEHTCSFKFQLQAWPRVQRGRPEWFTAIPTTLHDSSWNKNIMAYWHILFEQICFTLVLFVLLGHWSTSRGAQGASINITKTNNSLWKLQQKTPCQLKIVCERIHFVWRAGGTWGMLQMLVPIIFELWSTGKMSMWKRWTIASHIQVKPTIHSEDLATGGEDSDSACQLCWTHLLPYHELSMPAEQKSPLGRWDLQNSPGQFEPRHFGIRQQTLVA